MATATQDPPAPVGAEELDDRVGAAAESQPGDPPAEPDPAADPSQEPGGEPTDPSEPDPQAGQDDEPEIVLEGTGQLSFGVGGKKPTSSELKLQGGSIGIDGQFSKGEILVLRLEVRVGEVAFVDKIDSSTGQPTASTRRHKARVVAAVRES